MPRRARVTREEAESIAIRALGYLAADPGRTARFLQLSGLELADLSTLARAPQFQAAVLSNLRGDESNLLSFAANTGIDPATIATAEALLSGEAGD